MQIDSLEKLFIDNLKDVYNAEKQLVKALPRMAKAATDSELQTAFTNHFRQTEKQVERLEQIFRELGKNPVGKKCAGMEGLLEEGKELLQEDIEEEVLDAGLIVAAQKVEHYEIAAYGSLKTFARLLGLDTAERLLDETLTEEKEADRLLTTIADRSINVDALSGGDRE